MNYSALLQAVQDTTENSEATFVANIPNFVQRTEERIYNAVQIPAIRKNITGSLQTGNKYLALPGDYLATFSLALIDPVTTAQTFLLDKDVNFIREAYADPTVLAPPQFFAQFAPYTLIVGPTPDKDYTVELHEYYYPESIVTAGTSWIGDNFETVLFYGTLREAYVYMKGETDMLQAYDKAYQESLALLKKLGDGKERRSAYRAGQVRVPVD